MKHVQHKIHHHHRQTYSMTFLKSQSICTRTIKGHDRKDLVRASNVNRHHRVLSVDCRRAIKEGSVIAHCKRIDNQACSALQNYRIITLFPVLFNTFSAQTLKVGMSNDFSKFVNYITVEFWVGNPLIKERI